MARRRSTISLVITNSLMRFWDGKVYMASSSNSSRIIIRPASADLALDRLARHRLQRVVRELQLDVVEVELLLILLHQSVLRLGENLDQRAFVEFVQHAANRQPADKLRNQSETNQIFRLHLRQRFGMAVRAGLNLGMKAERLVAQSPFDNFFQTDKRATADETGCWLCRSGKNS